MVEAFGDARSDIGETMKSSLFLYHNVTADLEDNWLNAKMENTKRCPYCGEEILDVAKKCKHCGEWLDKNAMSQTHSELQNKGSRAILGIPDKVKSSSKASVGNSPIAGKGCLIAIVAIAVIFLIIFLVNSISDTGSVRSNTDYNDTVTWEEVVVEEIPNDDYVEGVDYSDGVIGDYDGNSNDNYDRYDYYGE